MRLDVLPIVLLAACIGYGTAALAQPGPADSKPPFELSISTEKASYRSGDAIALKLAFHNHGARSISLVHPDFWGVTDIRVLDGEGRAVSPESFKGQRKSVADILTLPPGETKTFVFDNLTAWTCCYGYTFQLPKPGRYQLTVSITNPPIKVKPPANWKPVWTGTATSNTVTIDVRR